MTVKFLKTEGRCQQTSSGWNENCSVIKWWRKLDKTESENIRTEL